MDRNVLDQVKEQARRNTEKRVKEALDARKASDKESSRSEAKARAASATEAEVVSSKKK